MERLFRILINYKIKYLIPVLLLIGMFITSLGIIFTIYFIVDNTIDRQITNGIIYHRNLILYILNKNTKIINGNQQLQKELFYNDLLFHSNNLYHIFIINKENSNIVFSNYKVFQNRNFHQILERYKDSLAFEWNDILNAKSYIEKNKKKKIYKKNNYYFYIEELNQDYWLIIIYAFNWFDIFNIKNITILIIVFIVLIFLPFWFFFYFYKQFYETRIEYLLNAVEKISEGDLSSMVPVIGNDEITQISSFVNRMKDQLKEIIFEDSLTKVLNRKGFEFYSSKLLTLNKECAIFFMDLDGFKYVNETYGHDIGDKALQIVAKRLKQLCQANLLNAKMILGRIGGDEFALLIDLTNLKEAYLDIQIFALKIIEDISQKYEVQNITFNLGISIGIAIYPEHGKNLNELLTNADLAMYQVKYSTKNSYYFFDSKLKSFYEQKNQLRNELITIFRNHQIQDHFYLVYQPIYNLKLKKINHIEVLLRFQHPLLKSYPADFIPLLEELNYISIIGNYIIKKSIEDLIDIQNRLNEKINISINISPKQIIDKNFYKDIMLLYNTYSKYNIKTNQIILEITENILIDNPAKVLRVINSLHDIGFSFAIDDFGTGFSSLSYLKELPVKYIKIDKKFTEDLVLNPKTELIVRSIINLAHLLGYNTIIEGIEDYITLKKVIELKGDYVQGYYLTPPLPKEELINFLEKPENYQLDNIFLENH
ncbi:MAG: hypothetical protein KatS3mg129_2586 [Leptospiraceae bacterium]|nr:MAG: hypothetical protein KatS3mg129_2586 [Leptospiraceae bacterium]